VLQMALKKSPELGRAVIMDFAHNERERQGLRLILARQQMGGLSGRRRSAPERAQALRQAFDAT